jgi:hypothetical protein
MNLTDKDLSLILTILENGRIGKWGDDTHLKEKRLINKLQRAGVREWHY